MNNLWPGGLHEGIPTYGDSAMPDDFPDVTDPREPDLPGPNYPFDNTAPEF